MAHSPRHGVAAAAGRVWTAVAVVGALLAAEVVTALLSGSLALLGDAGHLLTDTASLGLVAVAIRRSRQPASPRRTFGHARSGTLAAALNGLALLAVAVALAVAAGLRLAHPPVVSPLPVVAVAGAALAVNAGLALLLRGAGSELSVSSALLHVTSDGVASAGVVASGLVILATGWEWADPAVSLLIATLIAVGAVRLLRETGRILGEGTPGDLDAERVRHAILTVPGVDGVHDLHLWSLDRGHRLLSAHVTVGDRPMAEVTAILREVEERLCSSFGIEHVTLQPECPACLAEPALYCDLEDRHQLHRSATAPGAFTGP